MTDTGVLVLLGLLHVLALCCGVLLIKLLLRELPGWRWWTDDDERRGRGEPSIPPTRPTSPADGLPLLDSTPAAVQLRGPAPLVHRRPAARPCNHPRPGRRPAPGRRQVR